MAWVKIPAENHALFYERLPKDTRIQTLQMFGSAAAKVNGHLFGGLFARSFMVKLSDADHAEALALDGAERFDPMGTGRVMSNSVLMPEWLMDDPDEMTAWLRRALAYTLTLPPKKAKAVRKTTPAAKPTKTAPKSTKPAAKTKSTKPATKTKSTKPAAKPTPRR
jgi:TfoX/Sxy family transcriptional regulator of competence genes